MSSADKPRPRPRPGPKPASEPEAEPVVIRDKRRIDPVTGEARPAPPEAATPAPGGPSSPGAPAGSGAAGSAGSASAGEASAAAEAEQQLAERTADLQRVQAEYANYRKRADRERTGAGDAAISRVLGELVPILDDLDRARAHGDLTGGLKAVADHLDTVFGKFGLVSFGEVGDPFDPTIHEAVTHTESDEVSAATCTMVMRPGYKHGDRLLRAAMVGVTEPATPPPPAPPAETSPAPDAPDTRDQRRVDDASQHEPSVDQDE